MMDTDETAATAPVVLPPTTSKSNLNLALHPLAILNISGHLTRLRLQTLKRGPFAFGALLGTQNGREVEIVNSFEMVLAESPLNDRLTAATLSPPSPDIKIDHAFFTSRRDQYKQVFPSLDFVGWYVVALDPTPLHVHLHEQFTTYTSNPLLLVLHPTQQQQDGGVLPFKAYEPSVEIRDRKSRTVYIEAPYKIETGEAERIAVDSTAKGGEGTGKLTSHLQTQRAAVKMLHDRIVTLVEYVSNCIQGSAKRDPEVLRSIAALVASLPASENKYFREEFETEESDVLLTTYLSTLTKSQNLLNDLVDKHLVLTDNGGKESGATMGGGAGPRGKRRGVAPMGSRFAGGGSGAVGAGGTALGLGDDGGPWNR